jgi:deazaflavin-dependent oxidoreductase (nitroreductase family)
MIQPSAKEPASATAPAWRQRVQYTYLRLIRPVMVRLLKSPLHGLVSHNIMLITFIGRKSGTRYTTPVSYARSGQTLTFATPRHYGWWKNLRAHPAVDVLVQRTTLDGRATVIVEELDDKVARIQGMLQLVPRDAKYYPIRIGPGGVPDPRDLLDTARAHVVVLVEVDEQALPTSGGM